MTHKSIYVLPNLITTGNMFCGFLAIIHSMHSDHVKAAWLLILAAIFDSLDGRVARMAKATSAFGVEYDSLSDLVSFGVAPALIAYQMSLESFGRLGWAVSFLFLVCAALRLARFNVSTHIAPKGYFQGLPTPIACGVLATWILFLDHTGLFEDTRSYVTLGMFVLLPFLMVSLVPFPSFKEVNWRSKSSRGYFLLAIVSIVLILIRPEVTMFSILSLYIVVNLLIAALKLTRAKSVAVSTVFLFALLAHAEDGSVQPYIDDIKANQKAEDVQSDADAIDYTQKIKTQLPPEDPNEQSAIQKTLEGRSDLKIKKRGNIHYEAGFRIGTSFERTVTPSPSLFQWNDYNRTFGNGWNPDFQFYFGWQPLHHDLFGSLGLSIGMGAATNAGMGGLVNARSPVAAHAPRNASPVAVASLAYCFATGP